MTPTWRQMPFLEIRNCREQVKFLVKGVATWRQWMCVSETGRGGWIWE